MGLKCKISYREGEVVVRKDNGELSDLYYELLDYAKSPSIALDMWATAHSREMGEIGEDATVDEVVRYFDSAVASSVSLSPSEKMQVKDFMRRNGIETLDSLNRILTASFKPNGVFEINPVAAVNSGLFSQDELAEIDPLALQDLLLKIEGNLATENFSVEPETQREFYKDSSSKTIFGTYDRVSQDEVDNAILSKVTDFNNIEDFYEKIKELPYEDFVTRFTEDDEFANTIINRFSGLKRIPKLSIVGGELSLENNKVFTTTKNTLLANQDTTKVEAEIDYLNSIDQEVWDANPELIRSVLKEVEQEFVSLNVDIVGISEFPARRSEVMAVIESANQMLNVISDETIKTFSDNLTNLVPVEDTVVVENIPTNYTGYNIVSLHTEIPENELFNTYGLIKVGDNLFHKLDQNANITDVLDFIYNEILEKRMSIPSEYMLTKDITDKSSVLTDISRYLMSRNTIAGLQNKELYSGYQVAFNHQQLPSKVSEVKDLAVIKTDENYLKLSFVSDFYNYILREKALNTSTYKSILSKFEITDRDITLTDTIPSIEGIEFQQELSDYIRLQKDSNMKYLVEPTTEVVSEDLLYTNFPEAKTEYEGDFVMLGDYVITPTTSDNYIKINGELYRRGLDRENGRLFVKVPQRGDSKYYTRNLSFEFNRAEASQAFDKYTSIDKNSVDYSTFKSVISKSRIEDDMNVNLKEFSTLKDKSYTFAQVNNSIVAFKDGMRVGSIRYTKTADGYATPELSVSEIHRGKGIATELYLKMFDKILKEEKVFYPSEIRTQAAQNVFSRLEGLLVPTPSGGFRVSDSISTITTTPEVLFSQPSDIVKEVQIVPREAFELVAEKLKQTGLLKGDLIVNKQGFVKGLRAANTANKSSASPNEVAGFVLGEDVFINPDSLNYNTPIHEYGHLWAKWARDFRPDLYNKGLELVRGSEYYNDIVARSKDKNSVYFEYAEDKILEEALVTAIGNQGESFVNKTKFNSFQQFLTDLWASIKEALGLTQMRPDQVANLTLDQFTEAVAIDLLRGERFKTTPYTITALLDPMLANKEGKMVNVQTIKQVLNQASTKKIEKDIINEVLNLEYFKGKDKIPFDYFKAEVNTRLMPLDVIVSDTYASYGSNNVDTSAKVFETHIFNTDLDHQIEGHFRSDFSKTDDLRFEIRETNGTFFVVEDGAVLTNENINDKVFTATDTRERAQAWIDNYDNTRSLNKGLFGHSRMWYDNSNKIAYGAEFQSDSYQKAKAADMLITTYTRDESKLSEAQKPIWEKLKALRDITDKARRNLDEFFNVKDLSEGISDRIERVKSLNQEIERYQNEVNADPNDESLKRILDRKKRRRDLTKSELDQLIKLAKGEKMTLPEEVEWTENDPGGFADQVSIIPLVFDSINKVIRNTRSYKIKNGKQEYTLYHDKKNGFFFEKDMYAFNEKSRDQILQNFIELVDKISREVILGDKNLANEPLLEDLLNKISNTNLKNPLKVSEILDVLEQVVPNISRLGANEAFSRRLELGTQKVLLRDKGRTSENLIEIDRRIQRLFEAQLNVRNNRDFDALENEIQDLRDKANGAGLLNEEDQAEYNRIESELAVLDREYRLFFENGLIEVFGINDSIAKNGIAELRKALPLNATIKFDVEPLESYQLESASRESFYSLGEAFDVYNATTLENNKVNPDGYVKYFNALREIPKLEEKLINEASLNDKQFVAHRKNYTERLLREEIRRSAEMGMEEFRIPTPRTLALIEGYIEPEGNAPYDVVRGESDYLEPGDEIEYLGDAYYVISSDYQTIEIASKDKVDWLDVDDFRSEDIYSRVGEDIYEIEKSFEYDKEYTFEEVMEKESYELQKLDLSKFNIYQAKFDYGYDSWVVLYRSENTVVEFFGTEQEAIDYKNSIDNNTYIFDESTLRDELDSYYESTTDYGRSFAEDYGYIVYAEDGRYLLTSFENVSTETLNQPNRYDSAASLEDFNIEDMSSEQQTVLRKYEELIDLFKKNRPDSNIQLDSAGNEWLSSRLTQEDGTRPVVVFMETSQRVAPSKDIENVSTIFDSRLELLDLYSSKEEAEIIKDINDCGA